MASKPLHLTQKKLLKLLVDNADSPLTIRELQEILEVTSTSVVAHHMQQLENKGYLKRNPYNPKDYQVISGSPERLITYINLYGLAACGPDGTLLDGDPIERIPLYSKLLSFPSAEAFMVKAKGKSMEPRINEGDLIIARKTQKISSGKIYVCVNDGEAMIKEVISNEKKYILRSFNPSVQPFIASSDFRVEGEVKTIISGRL